MGGRVLILSENLSVPFDRRVWMEATALVRDGHDVTVIAPKGGKRDNEDDAVVEGVRIRRFRLDAVEGKAMSYPSEYATAVFNLLRLSLGLGRFDVVHVCNPPDLLFLAALPHTLRGAKLVFDQHDLVPELYLSRFERGRDVGYWACRFAERMTYRFADHVIATNESYQSVACTRGGVAPADVTVVRSGPSLDRFSTGPGNAELKRGKPHLLVYLGVMGPQDGVDYALRSLRHLRDEREDWHAAFVGSGDAQQAMRALSGELGLDGDVEFTGRISDEELLEYLSTADVCLSPDPKNPLNDLSTMNKVLEYMAMGRSIVSFELREAQVSAGDAAVYAPANDERRFAQRIAELLDDPAERSRRGALGRTRMEESLAWHHSERNLVALYRTLTSTQ